MATKEELEALRTSLVNARTSLLTGQAVKEVWRDGRRVVYQGVSVAEINDAIDQVDVDIAKIDAGTGSTTRPRYHGLSVRFQG